MGHTALPCLAYPSFFPSHSTIAPIGPSPPPYQVRLRRRCLNQQHQQQQKIKVARFSSAIGVLLSDQARCALCSLLAATDLLRHSVLRATITLAHLGDRWVTHGLLKCALCSNKSGVVQYRILLALLLVPHMFRLPKWPRIAVLSTRVAQ